MASLIPVRAQLTLAGRRLSYLDFGGDGQPLLALHGHLDEGRTWAELARGLFPARRVIAPDQRGHGDSGRALSYAREDYLADAIALLDHLGVDRVVAAGHSGGGITAYQLADRHPERIRALVIEDAPALNDGPNRLDFLAGIPYQAATRAELLAGLGPAAPLFGEALRPLPEGRWRLPFHPADMIASEQLNKGDYWANWLGSHCPALLVVGARSPLFVDGQAQAMASRRPGTRLVELDADHFVHTQDPAGFTAAVRSFLDGLDRPA